MTSAQDEFDALFAEKSTSKHHPEDESSASEPEEEEEAFYERDDLDEQLDHQSDTMRSKYFLPRATSNANTGPKGVIADAQAFEHAKRTHRFSWRRSSPPQQQQMPTPEKPQTKKWRSQSGSSIEEEEDEGDDDFMAKWRQRRLRELQEPAPQKRGGSQNLAVRMYGRLIGVEAEGFLEAVESTPDDTVVAVFIYDDMSEVSLMVEDCIRDLARIHTNTRFIKMHFEDAEMEVAGVPALLAYRGGNKFAGLVPLVDEIPDDAELSVTTLEVVLKKHQILI